MGERTTLPLQLVVGGGITLTFVGAGLLSLVWVPHDLAGINVSERLAPPGTEHHPLGTDQLGRDVLSQIMAGAQTSLLVALVSTAIAVVGGVALGLVIAGSGRVWRDVLSRATDVAIALPGLLIALVLATFAGPGNTTAVIAIVFSFVPGVARFTIGPARQILARDFVEAAFAYGRTRGFVLLRHVLPNIGPLIIVLTSLLFAGAILLEASLSYLGLGAQSPTPSWGRLLNESQGLMGSTPSLTVIPGLAIVLVVVGLNLLGDGLRVMLDTRRMAKEVV